MKKLCKVVYTVSYETYLDLEVPEDLTEIVDENGMKFEKLIEDNADILFNINIPEDKNSEYVSGSMYVEKFVPSV